MHKLRWHPRGFVDLVKGTKVVLDLHSPCEEMFMLMFEGTLRRHLLARRTGWLSGAVPR